MTMATLEDVLSKYRSHPEFLRIDLTRPDQKGAVDDTPLHVAALTGNVPAILKLLELGANPGLRNEFLETPLRIAQTGGKSDAIAALIPLSE